MTLALYVSYLQTKLKDSPKPSARHLGGLSLVSPDNTTLYISQFGGGLFFVSFHLAWQHCILELFIGNSTKGFAFRDGIDRRGGPHLQRTQRLMWPLKLCLQIWVAMALLELSRLMSAATSGLLLGQQRSTCKSGALGRQVPTNFSLGLLKLLPISLWCFDNQLLLRILHACSVHPEHQLKFTSCTPSHCV